MKEQLQYTILKNNLNAQLNGVAVLPICLYGGPGLGKSSVIDQAAKDLGASNNTISISSVNYEFFSGIPSFATDTGLDQYSASGAKDVQSTIWTIPELISSTNRMAEANPNGVVLHLEDYHTMDKTTENVMYQLLLDRKLGDYNLHPKVAIVASMNNSKESGGGHFNSAAVKSRVSLMEYTFNFQYWYDNFGNTLHPWISSFLKTNQQYIVETESKTLDPSGSARSYTKLSLDFGLYDTPTLEQVYIELARGKVSDNAVAALEAHVTYYQKIDFDGIVKNKTIPVLSKLPELDKVLWGYVVHSIVTPDDAVYLIELLNDVMAQPHSDTLIGFVAGELYSKFSQQNAGIEITVGQDIVLKKVLECYDPSAYKLTPKAKKKLDTTNITDVNALSCKIAEYAL